MGEGVVGGEGEEEVVGEEMEGGSWCHRVGVVG